MWIEKKGVNFQNIIYSSLGLLFLLMSPLEAAHNLSLNDHWNLNGEFVYLRRQHSSAKPFVNQSDKVRVCGKCTDYTVLKTNTLINDEWFEPGYRVGIAYRPNARISLEANFLWVAEWEGEKQKEGDGTLFFGFKDSSYTGDYIDADEAKGNYNTQFWTGEANCWCHWTPRFVDFFSLSGIFGFRYFHFNEGLDITYEKSTDKSHYKIHTKNDSYGAQIGLDLQVNPMRHFSWETSAKFGLMMTAEKQKQVLRDLDDTEILQQGSRHKWQNGCFIDLAAWLAYQVFTHLNVHVGYEMLFLSSVATAEDQIRKQLNTEAAKKIDPNGAVIIHGLFGGVILSF
jgi:hypothetical protein